MDYFGSLALQFSPYKPSLCKILHKLVIAICNKCHPLPTESIRYSYCNKLVPQVKKKHTHLLIS